MTTVGVALTVVCLILLGAINGKPVGWVVIGLAVLVLLLQLFGVRL